MLQHIGSENDGIQPVNFWPAMDLDPSIVDQKEDSNLASLLRRDGTNALLSNISRLDDFEQMTFVVIQ